MKHISEELENLVSHIHHKLAVEPKTSIDFIGDPINFKWDPEENLHEGAIMGEMTVNVPKKDKSGWMNVIVRLSPCTDLEDVVQQEIRSLGQPSFNVRVVGGLLETNPWRVLAARMEKAN